VGAAGHRVADAVTTHEGLGRHDRLLSPTNFLSSHHLLSQLGRDLASRRGGLDGHHPWLVAFSANYFSTALEFWRRRWQERLHLWSLPEQTHISFQSGQPGDAHFAFGFFRRHAAVLSLFFSFFSSSVWILSLRTSRPLFSWYSLRCNSESNCILKLTVFHTGALAHK
jgi:hypothetical protein